jgi:hypothetical protein
MMMIRCGKLTTCKPLGDGETLKLDLIDGDGKPVSVLLSFEHAESIAMTLPRLLTQAVKAQTGQDNARYVFPLGPWRLERIEDSHSFILTWPRWMDLRCHSEFRTMPAGRSDGR